MYIMYSGDVQSGLAALSAKLAGTQMNANISLVHLTLKPHLLGANFEVIYKL